ncbi:MAG: hypothetical protein WKF75_00485 [Singulisphaera sp.]
MEGASTSTVEFTLPELPEGFWLGHVGAETDDDLPFDDRRYFALPVAPRHRSSSLTATRAGRRSSRKRSSSRPPSGSPRPASGTRRPVRGDLDRTLRRLGTARPGGDPGRRAGERRGPGRT